MNTLITPGWAVTVVGRPLFTILLVLAVSVFAGYQARTITLGSVTDGLLVERGPRPDRSQFPKPANLILAIEAPTHVFDAGFLTLLANTSGKIAQLELVEQVTGLSTLQVPDTRKIIPPMVPLIEKYAATASGFAAMERETRFLTGNALVSRDKRSAFIHVSSTRESLTDAQSIQLVNQIRQLLDGAGLDFDMVGQPVVRDALVNSAVRDTVTSVAVTGLITMLVLLLLYRSIQLMLFPLMVAACSITITAWFMVENAYIVNNLTILIAPLLVVISVASCIHIVSAFQRHCAYGESREQAAIIALREKTKPCLLASLTTAIGFLALSLTSTPLLVEFSVSAAFGIFVVFLVAVTLLPALLSFGGRSPRCVVHTETIDRFLARLPGRRRILVLLVFLLPTLALGWGLSRTVSDTVMLNIFKGDDPIYLSHQQVADKVGGISTIELLVRAPPGSILTPNGLQWLSQLEALLKQEKGVTEVLSLAHVLGVANAYLQRNPYGPAELPATVKRIDELIDLLKEKQSDSLLDPFLNDTIDTTRLIISADTAGTNDVVRLHQRIHETISGMMPPYATFILQNHEYDYALALNSIVNDQVRSFGLLTISIFIVLLLAFRSLSIAIIALVVNLVPIVWVFGTMGWLGIPVDFFNIMVACIALGIVIDDTVHFLAHYQSKTKIPGSKVKNTLRVVGVPITVTSIVLGSGFIGIASSATLAGTAQFALFTALAILVALLATLWMLPALVAMTRGRVRPGP